MHYMPYAMEYTCSFMSCRLIARGRGYSECSAAFLNKGSTRFTIKSFIMFKKLVKKSTILLQFYELKHPQLNVLATALLCITLQIIVVVKMCCITVVFLCRNLQQLISKKHIHWNTMCIYPLHYFCFYK